MGKKKQQRNESDDEAQHDKLAWGKSKQRYYQEQDEQYSELSEQNAEVKEIYQQQFNLLNEKEYYDLPEEEEEIQSQAEQTTNLSDEFLKNQILQITQTAKQFSKIDDQFTPMRKKLCDTYLLILVTLKTCKIPYIDQHPMLSHIPDLKKGIQYFSSMSQFAEDQIEEEQAELSEIDQYSEQKKEGLQVYNKLKEINNKVRKEKKAEKKRSLMKQQETVETFKKVGENEGRLINEKISKNKGLMKKRKKIQGNSRVKLRQKWKKAQIRSKSRAGKVVRANPGRAYEGQPNIRYGRAAGVKLK